MNRFGIAILLIVVLLTANLLTGCAEQVPAPPTTPTTELSKTATPTPTVTITPTTTHTLTSTLTHTPVSTPPLAPAPPPPVSHAGPITEAKIALKGPQFDIYDITYLSDGLKVKGYLAQPKLSGTYPAIIWNRGGNLDFSPVEPKKIMSYAQNGYVAVASQYRGNMGGEGQEEFGGADIYDVLNLVPLLKSLPNVDTNRIGMVGYSRGGMMTYLALKEQTLAEKNDIKAACTVGGLADLFMAAEERPKLMTGVFKPLIGGSPSQVPEEYEARSATYWADEINVPILIQHGEDDESVSVEQAKKLAGELDKYGKVYKLITYPGDDHGLSGHQGGLFEILSWLDNYLH